MKVNKKPCKGSGRAYGYGCELPVYRFRFGLCKTCYQDWLLNTEDGREYTLKMMIKSKPKPKKIKRKHVPWKEKPLPEMKGHVQSQFCNPYIRQRDIENFGFCISSGKEISDAGHYYSRGSCESMRFCVQNIHGQGWYENRKKGGDLVNYTSGLTSRYGIKYLNELQELKAFYSTGNHLDREEVIKIGETYKYLLKNKIWVFTEARFNEIKESL